MNFDAFVFINSVLWFYWKNKGGSHVDYYGSFGWWSIRGGNNRSCGMDLVQRCSCCRNGRFVHSGRPVAREVLVLRWRNTHKSLDWTTVAKNTLATNTIQKDTNYIKGCISYSEATHKKVVFFFYTKCFCVKACPEPCFRYFSKTNACCFEGKAQNHFKVYGALVFE